MKAKKMVSILCALSIVLMNSGTLVHAENLSDTTELLTEIETSLEEGNTDEEDKVLGDVLSLEDLASLTESDDVEDVSLVDLPDFSIQNTTGVSDFEIQKADDINYDLDSATLIGELSRAKLRSAGSITQSFTDYLTAEGESKYVQFSLEEGEIFNGTLVCPDNANLNYDLVLASIEDDGSLTIVDICNLDTYIDPDTGKTVDEGISYIHNQATTGNFAIFVVATTGSSSINSFTLTISLDAAGAYDGNEPNDSAFHATSLSSLSISGSLHVVNDQDWYAVNVTSGVYAVTAGDYQAEVYYVEDGNTLVSAVKSGSNYVLGNGVYYVKVFSNAAQDEFLFGNYTLDLVDQSKYATMQTAYDFGTWEYSYAKTPDVIPRGQQTAYYKFTIDTEDRVYARILISPNETSGTLIEFLDNNGTLIDYGFTGSDGVAIPTRGLIERSNSTFKYLVVNIDGNQTNSTGYIRVTKVDPMDLISGGIPSLNTRIHSGYDTFTFSGTAQNSGGSISTVLTLDLTNSSKIPPNAVVDRISTSSSISYNVGGVYHQLNPDGKGWIAAATTNATHGSFDLSGYNIYAKGLWQFRYSQTALMSTTMSSVKMNIYWDYDIQYTNYELFQ